MRINEKTELNNVEKSDLHMHTIYCDGKNTPEEMVLEAISKGMECIGFSGHSFVEQEPDLGMNREEAKEYLQVIRQLKEKYKGQIRIYCGIEQDYLSETALEDYDYIIGSVHYIDTPDGPAAVDDTPEIFIHAVEEYYDGDYYLAAENYYQQVMHVIEKTGADIIGHFDLFSKFNQKEKLFDENDERYRKVWKKALDQLIREKKIFEINTGAIARGWRDIPYPAPEMIDYIKESEGQFILSGDSHTKENIGFSFENAKQYL